MREIGFHLSLQEKRRRQRTLIQHSFSVDLEDPLAFRQRSKWTIPVSVWLLDFSQTGGPPTSGVSFVPLSSRWTRGSVF